MTLHMRSLYLSFDEREAMTRGRGPSRKGGVESLWFRQSSCLITMSLSAEQLHKEGKSTNTACFLGYISIIY